MITIADIVAVVGALVAIAMAVISIRSARDRRQSDQEKHETDSESLRITAAEKVVDSYVALCGSMQLRLDVQNKRVSLMEEELRQIRAEYDNDRQKWRAQLDQLQQEKSKLEMRVAELERAGTA